MGTILAKQARAHAQLSKTLSDFREGLASVDLDTRFRRIRVAAAAGLSDFKAELQFKIEGLHEVRRDLREVEAWYRQFRARNHLERPSKVGSRLATVLQLLVLAVCIALATVVNAQLLGKTSTLGWVDGRLEVFVPAGLNIAIALFFGLCAIPCLWHRLTAIKLLGFASIIVYLTLIGTFNLALAHYRETPGTIAQGAGEAIVQRLLHTPLALNGGPSWLLLGLGTFFSIVALTVGLSMRENYPGYARATRRYRAARARYDACRERLINELSSTRATYEAALSAARAELTVQRAEHDALVRQRNAVLVQFDAYQDQLERDANALLKIYRDANVSVRPIAPPPHFQQSFELPRADVEGVHDGEWTPGDLKAGIKAAQGHLDWLLLDLQRQYEAGIAEQVSDPDFVDLVTKLAKLARAQGTSINELARLGVEAGTRARDWPPTIALGHEQLPFPPESAEISAESREQIRTTVMGQVLDLLKRYPVDIIEVVGHTDEQPIKGVHPSSLDDLAIPVLLRQQPASSLVAVDNAGLGLARAIAVARELAAIGPDRVRIVPLSAAQLLLPGDNLSHGRDSDNNAGRRRIEIRFRQSMTASTI